MTSTPCVGQVMTALRKGGHFKDLTPLESGVLNVFVSYADNLTAEGYPSIKQLAEDLGCDTRDRVRQAVHRLEQRGILVVVEQGGGRGHRTVRRLTCPVTDIYATEVKPMKVNRRTPVAVRDQSNHEERGAMNAPHETGAMAAPLSSLVESRKGCDERAQRGAISVAQRGAMNAPRSTYRTTQRSTHPDSVAAQRADGFAAGDRNEGKKDRPAKTSRPRVLTDEQLATRDQLTKWWISEAWPASNMGVEYPDFDGGDAAAVLKILKNREIAWDLDRAQSLLKIYLKQPPEYGAAGHPLRLAGQRLRVYLPLLKKEQIRFGRAGPTVGRLGNQTTTAFTARAG